MTLKCSQGCAHATLIYFSKSWSRVLFANSCAFRLLLKFISNIYNHVNHEMAVEIKIEGYFTYSDPFSQKHFVASPLL